RSRALARPVTSWAWTRRFSRPRRGGRAGARGECRFPIRRLTLIVAGDAGPAPGTRDAARGSTDASGRTTHSGSRGRGRARAQPARAEGRERAAPDPGARPDQAAVGAEQRLRIRRALDTLPPNARTIIMLSDVEGLSYREIASVLNCPIGTVMSRLHNARKRL